jgi:tetratricopeptide (TPR) repeat protein
MFAPNPLRHALRAAAVLAVLLSVGCGRGTADDHFASANQYAEQGQLAEAIIEYRSALQIDPNRGDIRVKLGDAYVRQGDTAGALQEYVRAADLLPNDKATQVRAGNFLLLARAFEDAQARAAKALALDPKYDEALILRGNALAGLKDMNWALAEYQEALLLNPKQEIAYRNIATIQVSRGEYTDAEATFRKAVEVAPRSVDARLALANFYWATGQGAKAEVPLKEAIAMDADNLEANRALALYYVSSNRVAEAEPLLKAMVRTDKTPNSSFSLVDYYLSSDRLDEAAAVLQELLRDQRLAVAAKLRLAALDVRRGERAQAIAKLREVLAEQPKAMAARLLNARLLLDEGKRDEALAAAVSIIAEEPNTRIAGQANLIAGGIYGLNSRYEDAVRHYEAALKWPEEALEASLALATLHMTAGAHDAAAGYVRQALTLDAENPAARTLMARLYLAQENLPKAKEEIASLLKDYPNTPPVLNLVAAHQLAAKETQLARATYLRSLSLDPNNFEALRGLVRLDVADNRPKDAVARIETALKNWKASSDLLILAATTYATVNNVIRSEEVLKQAIEVDPGRLDSYNLLGSLYAGQDRLDEARTFFEKAVAQNPKSIAANTMLGILLERQQRNAEAEAQYRKTLAIDERASLAANNLAWMYVTSNRNLDEALELARNAVQHMPDQPEFKDTLGWIYYRRSMHQEAVRHLEDTVRRAPRYADAHYHLGMAYLASGEVDLAKKSLERALAIRTDFEGASEARKALTQIGG